MISLKLLIFRLFQQIRHLHHEDNMAYKPFLDFELKDSGGDICKCKLRQPTSIEFSEYKDGQFRLIQEADGKKISKNEFVLQSYSEKTELFDILCLWVEYCYVDASGNKVIFGTDKPLSGDELKYLHQTTMLDVIPADFKIEAIASCIDKQPDAEEEKKS